MTNSTEAALWGALQNESCAPEFNGASNDMNGAEPAAVSTYKRRSRITPIIDTETFVGLQYDTETFVGLHKE